MTVPMPHAPYWLVTVLLMSSGKLRARDCFSRELDLDCNTQPRDAFAGLKTASLDSHCKRKRGCSLIVMCVFYMKASSISENKEK